MFIPDYILTAINILESNGFEAYIVGGCVRDYLMGNEPSDYDLTTDAEPEAIKKCFKDYKIVTTGEKHGTISVIINGKMVEITVYRIDGKYNDSRHPENVIFTSSLREDMKRRDFTINAMAINKKGEIIDYYNGKSDIENGIIRTVGDAYTRFNEDALRIMRGLRFASQLNFKIEEKTAEQIHKCGYLLKNISAERIKSEFVKLICGKNAAEILRKYSDVIEVFIPEIKAMIGFNQHTPYHRYDVWEHTLHALNNSPDTPLIRTIMFFHDIAKPDCLTIDENGTGHFKTHAPLGAEKAKKILKRLKFSSHEISEITKIIKNHRKTYKNTADVKRMLNNIGPDSFFTLITVKRADDSGKGYPDEKSKKRLDFAEKKAHEIIDNNICCSISQLAVNGNDLMSLGIYGKKIGETLQLILEEIINERLINTKEAIINYINSTK